MLLEPLILVAITATGQDSTSPVGVGKETVENVCTGCHEVETRVSVTRTKTGWQTTVDDMTRRGAMATAEEFSATVDNLTEFFGKVNVNRAAAKDSNTLKIGEREAQATV